MQRRTVVVVTSRHRKVRRSYTARMQCILLDTPMVKIIRNSIAADTLWVRKVRYRYVVASLHIRHTYAADTHIALPFLIMRSSHKRATFVRR